MRMKTIVGAGVGAIMSLGLVPLASTAQLSSIEGLNGCEFTTDKPTIDYNNAKRLTGIVGRSGCSNGVIWFYGALEKDGPGKNDTVLDSVRAPLSWGTVQYELKSWATSGDKYFTFAASSTGNSQVSEMITAD